MIGWEVWRRERGLARGRVAGNNRRNRVGNRLADVLVHQESAGPGAEHRARLAFKSELALAWRRPGIVTLELVGSTRTVIERRGRYHRWTSRARVRT